MKKSWQGLDFCMLRATSEEIIDHLFLAYLFSVHIWSKMVNYIKLNIHTLPRLQTGFGPLGEALLLINKTWLFEIYRRPLFFGLFGGNVIVDSLIAQ